jgi:hypothetical protein
MAWTETTLPFTDSSQTVLIGPYHLQNKKNQLVYKKYTGSANVLVLDAT